MILEELLLKDYRQYKGESRITFANKKDKNTTVIIGNNGAGKSNLFAALNWVLYGDEEDSTGGHNENVVNKAALRDAATGDRVVAQVRLKFTHEGDRYVVTREVGALKQGKEAPILDVPEPIFQKIPPKGGAEIIKNPNARMNAILPRNAKQYFFFDGEQVLERFTKVGHEEEVHRAVRDVLQYDVIERTAKHLDTLAREYQSELNKRAHGKEKELREKEIALQNSLEKKRNELKGLRDERQKAKTLIDATKATLHSRKKAKDIMAERDRLESELQQLSSRKTEAEDKIREDGNRAYYALSGHAIEKARKLLDEKRSKGEIPAGIREQFLVDLLDRHKCICQRPLGKGSPEEIAVRQLLNKSLSGTLENTLTEVYGQLSGISVQAREIQSRLKENIKLRLQYGKQMQEVRDSLDEVKEKLKKEDVEDIGALEKQLEGHERRHEDLCVDIGSLEEKIKVAEKDLDVVTKDLKEEARRSKHANTLSAKFELARDGANIARQVLDTFANGMRQKIEDKSREIFTAIIWKSAQFKEVKISDTYELEVLDRWNQPARKELSAGERQFFSLAFILAMAQVTSVEAPFVIDTPLARIDDIPRKRLAEELPDLVPQLILLMTNNEAAVVPTLKPHLGKQYRLDFKDGATTVSEEKV